MIDFDKAKVYMVKLLRKHKHLNRKELLNLMKQYIPEITDRQLRQIKKLINLDRDHRTIIGSDTKDGYYIIKTQEELNKTIKRIDEQAYDLLKEKTVLKEKFYNKKEIKMGVKKWEKIKAKTTKSGLRIYYIN